MSTDKTAIEIAQEYIDNPVVQDSLDEHYLRKKLFMHSFDSFSYNGCLEGNDLFLCFPQRKHILET